MSATAGPGDQLRILERWRKAQLDAAQSEYARLAARIEQCSAEVAQIEQQIGDAQEFARSALRRPGVLSPQALARLTDFAALQAAELGRCESTLAAAQAQVDAARDCVTKCFQELSVVEKLGERRAAQLRQAQQQRQQRWLDEQVAGRVGRPVDADRIA